MQTIADQSLTPDVNKNEPSVSTTTENTSKRKEAPTKQCQKNKAARTSGDSVAASSLTNIDEDEENDPQSSTSVWKYATRTPKKKHAICFDCGTQISTSNWSTSAIRRHLVLKHNRLDICLQNTSEAQQSSNVSRHLKEKLHRLCVEAIIRDSLPFNCFSKPGLSKVLKEALPGELHLLFYISYPLKVYKNFAHTNVVLRMHIVHFLECRCPISVHNFR